MTPIFQALVLVCALGAEPSEETCLGGTLERTFSNIGHCMSVAGNKSFELYAQFVTEMVPVGEIVVNCEVIKEETPT